MKEDGDKDGRTLPPQPPLWRCRWRPCLQPISNSTVHCPMFSPVCGCELGKLQSFQAVGHLTWLIHFCKRIQWDVIKLEDDINVSELKSHQGQWLTSIAVHILQIPL